MSTVTNLSEKSMIETSASKSEESTKTFKLSLLAAILIISNTVLLGVATRWFPDIIPTIPGVTIDSTILCSLTVDGLIIGALVLLGAIMLRVKPEYRKAWGILVTVFSLTSVITGGGFIIGFILGIIGGVSAVMGKNKIPVK
jgi:hypothetical protein